jgi:hypothetical protein
MKRIALVICLGVMALTLGVSTEALATLDRYACQCIPNGYYWLNIQTGLWATPETRRPRATSLTGATSRLGAQACPSGGCSTARTTGSGDARGVSPAGRGPCYAPGRRAPS